MNKTMKFVLRSPLHVIISNYLLLVTFTGRKSGKIYTTPVSYFQHGDDQVIIFTHAKWWKNLQSNPAVTLRLRGRDVQGTAEPVDEDKQAIADVLTEHLRQSHFDARYYDVTFDEQGEPIAEDIEKAVQTVTMIRVQCLN